MRRVLTAGVAALLMTVALIAAAPQKKAAPPPKKPAASRRPSRRPSPSRSTCPDVARAGREVGTPVLRGLRGTRSRPTASCCTCRSTRARLSCASTCTTDRWCLRPRCNPAALTRARQRRLARSRPTARCSAAAVVQTEFRRESDLFDRVGGGAGPGGLKAVAPIGDELIGIEVPEKVNDVSLLGEKLVVTQHRRAARPSPPKAGQSRSCSNAKVEYRPAPAKPAPKKKTQRAHAGQGEQGLADGAMLRASRTSGDQR